MKTIGQILRNKRQALGLLLRQVSAYVDIDQAILSKIERNERKPTKEMLEKLAEILKVDKDELLVQFISDKIAYEIADEDCASKVLKVAEKKVKYLKSHQIQTNYANINNRYRKYERS
ncbi:MAG: helix-turn-helix transcriptional regulator [Chitinophagales bacterium]